MKNELLKLKNVKIKDLKTTYNVVDMDLPAGNIIIKDKENEFILNCELNKKLTKVKKVNKVEKKAKDDLTKDVIIKDLNKIYNLDMAKVKKFHKYLSKNGFTKQDDNTYYTDNLLVKLDIDNKTVISFIVTDNTIADKQKQEIIKEIESDEDIFDLVSIHHKEPVGVVLKTKDREFTDLNFLASKSINGEDLNLYEKENKYYLVNNLDMSLKISNTKPDIFNEQDNNPKVDNFESKVVEKDRVTNMDLNFSHLKKARRNNKHLLLDADTLIYITALNTQKQLNLGEALDPEIKNKKLKKYLKEKYNYKLKENDVIDYANGIIYSAGDEEKIKQYLDEKILEIRKVTGTTVKSPVLAITKGKSFRNTLYPEYKENRKDKIRPAGLNLVTNIVKDMFITLEHNSLEADDIVTALRRYNPTKYILSAIDKDVLNSVSGKHFNPIWTDPKWVETDRLQSIRWKFIQTLSGDTIDNIKGCRGVGKKGAKELLENMNNTRGAWAITRDKFIEQKQKQKWKLLKEKEIQEAEEKGQDKPRFGKGWEQAHILTKEERLEAIDEAVFNLNLVDMTLLELDRDTNKYNLYLHRRAGEGLAKEKEPIIKDIDLSHPEI